MSDLRARFIEDYAGGILNISRQELSSSGEVLSQDGLSTEQTIFVEDGTGTKSGLKLGVGLVECVDPTTQMGNVNVRFADRTYTKIKDTKVFLTAVASAQAALSDAVTSSISNIETAIETLDITLANTDRRISSLNESFTEYVTTNNEKISGLVTEIEDTKSRLDTLNVSLVNNNLTLGAFSLTSLSRGAGNISIGLNSQKEMTLGNDNIFIGNDTAGLEQGSNNILIGSDARPYKSIISNEIVLGNAYHQGVKVSGEIYSPGAKSGQLGVELNKQNALDFILNISPSEIENEYGRRDYIFPTSGLRGSQNQYGFSGIVREDDSVAKLRMIPIIVAALQQMAILAQS